VSKIDERYNIPLDWRVANPYLILKLGQIARKANESDNRWTMVKKYSTETRSSNNTFASDAELLVPMESGKGYNFRGRIFVDVLAASDFKWQLTGPSVSLLRVFKQYFQDTNTGTLDVDSAFSQSVSILVGGVSQVIVLFEGICYPSADGAMSFQWAQVNSIAENTSVLKGSYIEWALI
jgi:hypothetical protein